VAAADGTVLNGARRQRHLANDNEKSIIPLLTPLAP